MSEHGIKHDESQALIDSAYEFAKVSHGDQKRKYTGEPYINHPVEVAQIVASVTDDVNMICAALLHDVVEDTPVTLDQLGARKLGFGHPIKDLVYWLTDKSKPEDGNRKTRKAIDRDHISQAPYAAKTVKLADLISNTSSIVEHDPDFAKVYMQEKKLLLEVLVSGDPTLYSRAAKLVADYFNKLDKDNE